MEYYKTSIRPALERMMADMAGEMRPSSCSFSTSRYGNNKALKAWFRVEAATFPERPGE